MADITGSYGGDPDIDIRDQAAQLLRLLGTTATALRFVAGAAAALWVVNVVALIWFNWDQSARFQDRAAAIAAQTLTGTWGWALVGVVAAGLSASISGQHLRVLLGALDVGSDQSD